MSDESADLPVSMEDDSGDEPDMRMPDMRPPTCMRDGETYEDGEEVCLDRKTFVCMSGQLIDQQMECGAPPPADIRLTDFSGGGTTRFGLEQILVTGTITNVGSEALYDVECKQTLKLAEQSFPINQIDDFYPRIDPNQSNMVVSSVDYNGLNNDKEATFTYECEADGEGPEAAMIGNRVEFTFTY